MTPRSASIGSAVIQGLGSPAAICVSAWLCGFDIAAGHTWAFGITCMITGAFLGQLDRHLRREE